LQHWLIENFVNEIADENVTVDNNGLEWQAQTK